MTVPVHVISIDAARYAAVALELRRHGFVAEPFWGVVGSAPDVRRRADVTPLARYFCTDKMLGCALSHLELARRLAAAWPTRTTAVLILEDDALVAGASPPLVAALAAAAPTWDILRLYCQGRCSPHARLFAGSTAAYLLSEAGARKLARHRAFYHIDMHHSGGGLRTVNGPRLFSTRDERTAGPLVGDQTLQFWLQQPILRVPGLGCPVTLAGALLAIAALLALGVLLGRRYPARVLLYGTAAVAVIVAWYERAYGYAEVQAAYRWPAAALTVGACVVLGGVWALARTWLVLLPLLFVLEVTAVAGAVGLASVH